MNTFLALCGLVFIGNTTTPEKEIPLLESEPQSIQVIRCDRESTCSTSELNLNDIVFIEEEEDIYFGFDTAAHLPDKFDPYAHPSDISSISYIEVEEEIDLGFDQKLYLPEGFDPFEPCFDLNSVEFIEEVEEIELNFNTNDYLPKGFDPYAR
jgi:hypothetical protein